MTEGSYPCPFDCGVPPYKFPMHLGKHLKKVHPEEVEGDTPVETFVPLKTRQGLRKMGWASRSRSTRSIRGVKIAVPDCNIIEEFTQSDGRVIKMTATGPCKHRRDEWWKTCTHLHPTAEELELLGYKGYPAYFASSTRDVISDVTTLDDDGELVVTGEKRKRLRVVTPNIQQVSGSIRNSGGVGPLVMLEYGGLSVQELGISPFCEFWDCWNQESFNAEGVQVKDHLTKYANGMFCTEAHSILLWADEHGTILPLDTGARGGQLRREAMDDLRVKVNA